MAEGINMPMIRADECADAMHKAEIQGARDTVEFLDHVLSGALDAEPAGPRAKGLRFALGLLEVITADLDRDRTAAQVHQGLRIAIAQKEMGRG